MKPILLLAGVLASAGAWAADSDFYLSGSIGQTRLVYPQAALDARLQALGMTGVSSVANNNPGAYRVQLGYRLNDLWSVEGGFTSLGTVSYAASGTFAAAAARATEQAKITAWNVSGVGKFPVSQAVSLVGKVGLTRVETTDSATAPGVGMSFWVNSNVVRTGLTYGIGLNIDVNNHFAVRGDMDSYDTGTSTGRVNVFTVGLNYRF